MKKRVLSALLALCLTLSLAGAAFAENEPSGDSSSVVSQAVSSVESEPQTQDETVSSDSASGEDQTAAKTESTPAPTETPAASDVAEEEPESTPEPEAATEPDTTPTPTEDPVADVTENEESDGSVEYTAALETDGETMNVIVTAPDGAFAEGVEPQLSVTMLTAEDELNDVADKLDTAKVQYDGFTALDITFTDKATGEEIEPVKEVSVRIELPQAIVDSGIDLNTLAVQHLEEDENGDVKNVNEVATLDNGITLSEEAAAAANEAAGVAPMSDMPAEEATAGDAAETPAAVAEFSVDGFSYFTITWTNYQNQTDVSRELTVTLIDEEGNELPGEHLAKYDISTSRNVTLNGQSSNIPYVQNYEFVRAVIALDADNANSGTTVYQIRLNADQETESVWHSLDGWQFGAIWRPGYGWGYWETVVVSTSYSWQYRISDSGVWTDFDENTQHIYLIYSKDIDGSAGGSGGDIEVQLPTPSISKTAIRNGDGETYSLNLSVTGGIGSQTETSYVDVLMIVDESNSMYNFSLLEPTRTAMRELVKELERNENVTARYGIVTFGSSGKQEMSWTSITEENFDPDAEDESYYGINRTAVGRKIAAITNRGGDDGGTNYMAGLDAAKDLINSSNNDPEYDRLTIVVFLSDGEPTYYVNQNGSNVAGHMGASTGFGTDSYEWRRTLEVADDIVCDQFYSVGIGNAKSDYLGTNDNFGGLAEVVSAGNPVDERFFNAGQGAENLTKKFKDIAGNATDLYIKNITIHDTLNLTNVQQVPDSKITVAVTNPSGVEVPLSEVRLTEAMITANYSNDQGLTFSIPNYELEPGYTYTVTMQIEPTEWAKTKYADQNYPDTATKDWYTGTHSYETGEKGIYSNDHATLNYEYTENEEGTEAEPLTYPMPVIQVPEVKTADLTITKDVQGIDPADLSTENGHTSIVNGQKFSFTVKKLDEDGELDTDFAKNDFVGGKKTVEITVDANGDGTTVLEDLPLGEYTVTESSYPQEFGDYTFDTKSGEAKAILKDENGDSVTVTNTYKHKDKTLTVIKTITGNMAYDQDTFQFTLNLIKDGSPYDLTGQLPSGVTKVNGVNGQYTFSLKAAVESNQVQFTLPYGVTATVTETPTDDYEESSRHYQTGTTPAAFDADNSETAVMNNNMTFEFQNKKEIVTPPTGLERNDTPYALMISVAVMAGLALAGGAVVRRRRRWME